MRWGASFAFVALVAVASPAAAQPSANDSAVATELFNAGRDLLKDGNVAAACPKLAESARLDPKVGTLARLAECEEHLGHLAAARGRWQQALNLARSSGDARATHAEGELARIDKVVPKIEIVVSGDPPAGLAVRLDDVELGPASLGVKLPVDPGHRMIRATAPGKKATAIEVDVRADGTVTRVVVPPLADDATTPTTAPPPPPLTTATAPPSSPPASEPPPPSSPWRTIGLASAGVGLVAMGTGAVFGVIAKSKRDDSNAPGGCVKDDCPAGGPTQARRDAVSAGNTATMLFVIGGVLAAAGVTVYLVAPSSSSSRAVRVSPSVAGFDLEGRF